MMGEVRAQAVDMGGGNGGGLTCWLLDTRGLWPGGKIMDSVEVGW